MLKELSDEVNIFVIMRENVQSNPGCKCLQEEGDILGGEEGPVTLLLNYPLPHPPGSWESGSNCRAFKDLPSEMLSDPGMRGTRPSNATVMLTWAVGVWRGCQPWGQGRGGGGGRKVGGGRWFCYY